MQLGGKLRPKIELHIVALQLTVDIADTICTSRTLFPNLTPAHLMILANCLENSYTFCHYVLNKVGQKPIPLTGYFNTPFLIYIITFDYKQHRNTGDIG